MNEVERRVAVRILFVEDSADDAELEMAALRAAGFQVQHRIVEDEAELRQALRDGTWDAIIADYQMPTFTGLQALRVVQDAQLDVPFLLVSGTIGEEVAVEAMRAGAQDYVLKENLSRLAVALERELREAAQRRQAGVRRRWLDLYARTGKPLAASLASRDLLEEVARLVASTVSDLCIIDLLEDGERLTRAAIAHADPARDAELRALAARLPPSADPPEPALVAMRQTRPLVSSLEDRGAAKRAAFPAIAEALGAPSTLSVPLCARGRTLGAINLASARGYDDFQLPFAEELAQRIALALDNARLYTEAQAAVRARDEFLSIASHELKTPLTPLLLQLESLLVLLGQKPPECADEKLLARLRRAIRTGERLGRLIESLLDVSRISVGRMQLRPERCDLTVVARELADRLRDEASRAGTTIRVDAPRSVIGTWDRLRIEQALMNLLSNAIKYGAGQPVEVEVEERGGQALVRIVDHGIGIAAVDLERIFGPFERAVSARNYGGLGLGLYIARQIVSAHGGRIAVQSAPGTGAAFTVELPLAPPVV